MNGECEELFNAHMAALRPVEETEREANEPDATVIDEREEIIRKLTEYAEELTEYGLKLGEIESKASDYYHENLDSTLHRITEEHNIPADAIITILEDTILFKETAIKANFLLKKTDIREICEKVNSERIIQPFPRDFTHTDQGNAERFLEAYGSDFRYIPQYKSWYFWNGKRWESDELNKAMLKANETVKKFYHVLETMKDPDECKKLSVHAGKSEDYKRKVNFLSLAQPYVSCAVKHFDANPDLMAVENGVLNLRTGELSEFKRSHRISKTCDVRYDPKARSKLWDDHLKLIFAHDQELIDSFQEIMGYCLLGENPEDLLIIPFGDGGNGKNVTFDTIAAIAAEYVGRIKNESIAEQKRRPAEHTGDLIPMVGSRIVFVAESEEETRLSEGTIKRLIGEKEASFRQVHGKEFTAPVTWTIIFSTNHKPKIYGTDNGIWRRVLPIPFLVKIPDEKKVLDYENILLSERDGIFNWMIEGLKRFNERGRLYIAPAIESARDEYRDESDILGQFFAESFILLKNIGRNEEMRTEGKKNLTAIAAYSAFERFEKGKSEDGDKERLDHWKMEGKEIVKFCKEWMKDNGHDERIATPQKINKYLKTILKIPLTTREKFETFQGSRIVIKSAFRFVGIRLRTNEDE